MAGTSFNDFNSLVNKNNEAIYIITTRTASGKKLLNYEQSKIVLATDTLAVCGIQLPPDIACIEIVDKTIVNYILEKELNLIVYKIDKKFYVLSRDEGMKNTLHNTLACGISAQVFANSRIVKPVILPFKPKENVAAQLKNAEVLRIPDVLDPLPPILKPVYRVTKTAPEECFSYPIEADMQRKYRKIGDNLSKIGYSTEVKKEVIREINDALCCTPITDDEMNNLLSNIFSSDLSAEFYGNKDQFLHNKMGDYLIKELKIKKDRTNNHLYFWDERVGIYTTDDDMLNCVMTKLCPTTKDHQRQEVIKYISSILSDDKTVFNENEFTVVFKNGILDLETLTLSPMTPDNHETIQINCDYNPSAKQTVADEFFNTATCGDKEIERLLYEAIGYSMTKTNDLQKAFLLLGGGRNGKSTYFEILKAILGDDNITTISFKDLAGSFRASALDGKLASFAGDISTKPITESDLFKSITAGEDVLIEKKFEQAYKKKLFSTMFFAANALPRTPDTSEGFFRRFCIIPFNASLEKVSRVNGLFFKKKLLAEENLEYIAYKAVTAIHNVLTTTYDFTQSEKVDKMIKIYKIQNSSVLAWFEDALGSNVRKLCNNIETSRMHYVRYKDWCVTNLRGACMFSNFTDQLCTNFNLEVNVRDFFRQKVREEEKNGDAFEGLIPIEKEFYQKDLVEMSEDS